MYRAVHVIRDTARPGQAARACFCFSEILGPCRRTRHLSFSGRGIACHGGVFFDGAGLSRVGTQLSLGVQLGWASSGTRKAVCCMDVASLGAFEEERSQAPRAAEEQKEKRAENE